jgi:CheY-like chemotaxis protein
MKPTTINLHDVVILVADPNVYARRIVTGMLRGFGANRLLEVDTSEALLRSLIGQKIDILLCDTCLGPETGLGVIRTIRSNPANENRTLPILLVTSDTREPTIKKARDAGANMVIAKPMSPISLYDRLAWIATSQRPFVDCPNYFGPDRRFKIEGYPNGVGRRKSDLAVAVEAEAGPSLAQDDIDNFFNTKRANQ